MSSDKHNGPRLTDHDVLHVLASHPAFDLRSAGILRTVNKEAAQAEVLEMGLYEKASFDLISMYADLSDLRPCEVLHAPKPDAIELKARRDLTELCTTYFPECVPLLPPPAAKDPPSQLAGAKTSALCVLLNLLTRVAHKRQSYFIFGHEMYPSFWQHMDNATLRAMNLLDDCAHLSSSHESVKKLAAPWTDLISSGIWDASYHMVSNILDVMIRPNESGERHWQLSGHALTQFFDKVGSLMRQYLDMLLALLRVFNEGKVMDMYLCIPAADPSLPKDHQYGCATRFLASAPRAKAEEEMKKLQADHQLMSVGKARRLLYAWRALKSAHAAHQAAQAKFRSAEANDTAFSGVGAAVVEAYKQLRQSEMKLRDKQGVYVYHVMTRQ